MLKIEKLCRELLFSGHPFFSGLVCELEENLVEDNGSKFALATDGTRLFFNPDLMDKYTDKQNMGGIAHEALHVGLLHPFRRGGRDPELWNESCDYAINGILRECGFKLPPGHLYDKRFQIEEPKGVFTWMASEQIYAILDRERRQNNGGGNPPPQPGQGQGQKPQYGQFKDPPKPDPNAPPDPNAKPDKTEIDWAIMVEQAKAVTDKFGNMGAGLDLAVKEARARNMNPLQILFNFVEQTVPKDQSYAHINRRFISQEPDPLYLPGIVRENMPAIAIGFDTSGSIAGDKAMVDFFGEICTEVNQTYKPESMDVYYCDTEVKGIQSFSPEDKVILKPVGNGGTEFQPVFDAIKASGKEYACVLYLTDLYGPDPEPPELPVIWVTSEASNLKGPYGETIRIAVR